MKILQRYAIAGAVLLLMVPAASADWTENFDSYTAGSGLIGQGGWDGWEGDIAFDAYVTDIFSYSTPNSAGIIPTSDVVQMFDENTGEFEMTAWCYIPSGSTGDQYFIMLNQYDPDSISNANWSVQVQFASDAGNVIDTYSTSTTPIINDTWVELKVEIYLDQNTYNLFYNDVFLASNDWQDGTGSNAIAAIDLFSDGGSNIFWDDLELVQTAVALEQTTWGHIKAIME